MSCFLAHPYFFFVFWAVCGDNEKKMGWGWDVRTGLTQPFWNLKNFAQLAVKVPYQICESDPPLCIGCAFVFFGWQIGDKCRRGFSTLLSLLISSLKTKNNSTQCFIATTSCCLSSCSAVNACTQPSLTQMRRKNAQEGNLCSTQRKQINIERQWNRYSGGPNETTGCTHSAKICKFDNQSVTDSAWFAD